MWVTVLQSRGLLVLVLAFQMPMKKGGGSTRRISQKKKAKVDPDLDRYICKNILTNRVILRQVLQNLFKLTHLEKVVLHFP